MPDRTLIYGVVVNNTLFSNKIECRCRKRIPNGIYVLDMDQDDFWETIEPANVLDAISYFRKASKLNVIKGIGFHDGIIPENPVKFKQLPIKVADPTYEELEEIEVVMIRDKFCYFLQVVNSDKTYVLLDLKDALTANKPVDLDKIKGITPEIRVAYTFSVLEKKRKELEEPAVLIKAMMSEVGAKVVNVLKNNTGYEVTWKYGEYTVNTALDKNFRVVAAGFCVSGYDDTQSVQSVVNLLKDYQEDGGYVNITRVR